jgi:hypothetical protein
VIKPKVAIKELHCAKLSWVEVLPTEQQAMWRELVEMLVEAGDLPFHRATRPEEAVGQATIVTLFDGSDAAYSAVVYTRWKLADGRFHVRLLV